MVPGDVCCGRRPMKGSVGVRSSTSDPMQTFLPTADFRECAQVLDSRRLGNQCYRECKTLYSGGWPNHPASRMWHGHEWYLCDYALALAYEIRGRKFFFKPHTGVKWVTYWYAQRARHDQYAPPRWLGDDRLHSSHRYALLEKDFDWYKQWDWPEQYIEPIDYYWPNP